MRLLFLSLLLIPLHAGISMAADAGPPAAVKAEKNGKYFDAGGNPTYNISRNGTVDWYTFSGYRRFNATCEVCHGFDGTGSSFAPDLTASLKTMNYYDFESIVIGGRKKINAAQNSVMPAFGTNRNVMCYLDDIYVYLRARSDGALGPGRPHGHQPKPPAAAKAEDSCMGFPGA
jgi:methanol metabolism-related c-type cytochrome